MKAIETSYAGCRFRSRLEARWAVFFDHLGIDWRYEPQGFDLRTRRYLPDFYLHNFVYTGSTPTGGIWVEVKGHDGAANWATLVEATHELPATPEGGEWNDDDFSPRVLLLGPVPDMSSGGTAYLSTLRPADQKNTVLWGAWPVDIIGDSAGMWHGLWGASFTSYDLDVPRSSGSMPLTPFSAKRHPPRSFTEPWHEDTMKVAGAYMKARRARFEYAR